jgi:hypothetical protein
LQYREKIFVEKTFNFIINAIRKSHKELLTELTPEDAQAKLEDL